MPSCGDMASGLPEQSGCTTVQGAVGRASGVGLGKCVEHWSCRKLETLGWKGGRGLCRGTWRGGSGCAGVTGLFRLGPQEDGQCWPHWVPVGGQGHSLKAWMKNQCHPGMRLLQPGAGGQPSLTGCVCRAGRPDVLSSPQVTRPCSYSRKSHFDFEDEDVDKLEIR